MNTEKNFVVLEFYPSFTPKVVREFATREDAVEFAELMKKSETGRHTHAVSSRTQPQSLKPAGTPIRAVFH